MNKHKRFFSTAHIPIMLFLLFYFFLISYKLISHPLPFFDWDESIYIQVGREMVQKNSLIPLWQGTQWLEKPPLVPLVYGLIIQYIPIQPEISTRIFSLLLSIGVLILIYKWILKALENQNTHETSWGTQIFATLVVVITAFNPLFIQKSQTGNTDVWLLIGILGYFLTFPNVGWSFLFLFIGVFSKSLLGFYPAFMIAGFSIYKKITDKTFPKQKLLDSLKIIAIQCGILLLWYVLMLILYKSEFITVHFRDHLLRRVTQSVESKFGKRTYYFDLIITYYGYFAAITLISIASMVFQWLRKKLNDQTLLASLFLLPYFLFLNLTKTKIEWYVYPAIPQAVFLIVYPLNLIKKLKPVYIGVMFVLIGYMMYKGVYTDNFFTSYYSQYDDNYKMAVFARSECEKLNVLIDGGSRNTHNTLQKLGLLLSTSDIYGNHPAIVYYFGKKTEFIYSVAEAQSAMKAGTKHECLAIDSADRNDFKDEEIKKQKKQFGSLYLYY